MEGYLEIHDPAPAAGFALRLMTKLRESPSAKARSVVDRWGELGLGELALALSTKLTMVEGIVGRVNGTLDEMGRAMNADCARVRKCLEQGFAYTHANPHDLLVDLDAFLFEARSAYEILVKFVRKLSSAAGLKITKSELENWLSAQGLDLTWINSLRKHRIHMFHNGAPWIAFRVESVEPLRTQLLVLKKNTHDFADTSKYIRMEELKQIMHGFRSLLPKLEQFLAERIAASDSESGQ